MISSTSAAAACHTLSPTALPPDSARFIEELEAALSQLPRMRPFHKSAAPDEETGALAAADERFQHSLHAMMTSGTLFDLEPEQRADPSVMEVAQRARLSANHAVIESIWDARDMLEDPNDPILARLDANPREVLDAAEFIDGAAARAGLPKRWRRRLHGVAKQLAWRIERQSARSVLAETLQRAERQLERARQGEADPFGEAVDEAYAQFQRERGRDFAPSPEDDPPPIQRPHSSPTPSPTTHPPAEPSGLPVPPSVPAPAPSSMPAPLDPGTSGADAQPGPSRPPAGNFPPNTAAPSTAAPTTTAPGVSAISAAEYEAVLEARRRNSAGMSRATVQRYIGYLVEVEWSERALEPPMVSSGVVAGANNGRLILLHNAYSRERISLRAVRSVVVVSANPKILYAAYRSAMAMLVAGAIMTPIGVGAAPFTWGLSLFLVCPGVVLLVFGIIRLRQTRDGYHQLRQAEGS